MAEEDIGSMLSRIRIAEKDDGILPLHTVWKPNEADVGRLRLVGKLLSRRRINLNGLHNALMASWNLKRAFKISEIGEKNYLFQFSDIGDLNKVLQRGPWNFSNSLLILKRFQASLTPEQYNFSTNPFWVRIFDVPVGLHSEQTGFMIGSSLGRVLEVDEGFKKAIRVRIELDVENPLRRFKTSQLTVTESRNLRIKYERLSEFCFVCGCLGHVESDCEIAHCIKDAGGKIIRRFGNWLKAEFENSWCPDDFAMLDDLFSKNTQCLGAARRADDPQQSAYAEIQILPNLPLCGSQVVSGNKDIGQVEGGHIKNCTTDIGLEVELNSSRAVLSPFAEVQLVDVPLSDQLRDMSNHTGKGTTAKANKGSWKRLAREVGSLGNTENGSRNKRRSCLTPMEDERALKVLINNAGVALANSAKGHDPPTG